MCVMMGGGLFVSLLGSLLRVDGTLDVRVLMCKRRRMI